MNPRCKWIGDIASQSRRKEIASLRQILTDQEVGLLHIFGDRGLGKRTLVQCLAQELLSGTPDVAKVFLVDLLSDPIALEEWSVESCDWLCKPDLPSGSLLDVLQALFTDKGSDDSVGTGDASFQADVADDSRFGNHVEQRLGASDAQQIEELTTGTPLDAEFKKETNVTRNEASTGTMSPNKVSNDGELAPKKILLVLRDYGDPGLQKRTIEEEAVLKIQNLLKGKRLVLVVLSEANLMDRSHTESQRLGAYRRLFYTTKGWQFKVGLLSTVDSARSAIQLSFEHIQQRDRPSFSLSESQSEAVLQAAGPHPGQIEQAVTRLTQYSDDGLLKRHLVDALLQANKAVYESTWNGLQQREKSVLLTYSLINRDELSRLDAQSKLERLTEDFRATATDFDDVEKKRGLPWSRVGQCLLPWSPRDEYPFFCEAFAAFVEQKLPPESSAVSSPFWRTFARTPMFLFLMLIASMAIGLVALLLTVAFDLPRLLPVFIPLLLVVAYFIVFLLSHVPALKR